MRTGARTGRNAKKATRTKISDEDDGDGDGDSDDDDDEHRHRDDTRGVDERTDGATTTPRAGPKKGPAGGPKWVQPSVLPSGSGGKLEPERQPDARFTWAPPGALPPICVCVCFSQPSCGVGSSF